MINQTRTLALALAVALLTLISGCVSSSRSNVTVQDSTEITKGKELSDLQRALGAGAVTKEEYQYLRKIIMDRPN